MRALLRRRRRRAMARTMVASARQLALEDLAHCIMGMLVVALVYSALLGLW
jgi:hypothetical protein